MKTLPFSEPIHELDESLKMHRFAMDHAPDPIFWADESKRLIYVNNAACESLGYSREELLQLTVPDISARHDSARFSDRWKIMADGGSAHYESTHRHKDGHLFPIKASLHRLSIGDENYTCAIIRDFTQLEKARVDLENSERINRLLMDIAFTANQALSVREVYKESLRLICEFKDWPVSHAYITDRDNGEILIPSSYWSLQPPIDRFDAFREVTDKSKFMKGEGLPGRVWEIGKPAWIEDVMTDPNYPRAGMTDDIGVHGAFGIPIFGQQELVAVLEFYSIRTESYDENFMAVAKQIGFHLGLAIHRIRLEEKLHRMNEELERRVQKRTTDLKTSNQKLEEALSK